jgi:hypothetical protein
MPKYEINVPGQGTFQIDSPTDLSDAQAYAAIQQHIKPPEAKASVPTVEIGPAVPNLYQQNKTATSDIPAVMPEFAQAIPESLRTPFTGSLVKGVTGVKSSYTENVLAELMAFREADIAKYGKNLEKASEKEKANFLGREEILQGKFKDLAGYAMQNKAVEEAYGKSELSKKIDTLTAKPEYKDATGLQKTGMYLSTLGKNLDELPGYIVNIGAESLPQSVSVIAAALAGRVGFGRSGAMAAGGSMSAFNEFGGNYAELRSQGMPHEEAWQKAAVKSGVIGYFDAASFGSAGIAAEKILGQIAKKEAIKSTIKEVGKETGKQALYGAAGEGLGSYVIGQPFDPRAVGEEAFGEVVGAPFEAATTYRSKTARPKTETKPEEPQFIVDEKGNLVPAPAPVPPTPPKPTITGQQQDLFGAGELPNQVDQSPFTENERKASEIERNIFALQQQEQTPEVKQQIADLQAQLPKGPGQTLDVLQQEHGALGRAYTALEQQKAALIQQRDATPKLDDKLVVTEQIKNIEAQQAQITARSAEIGVEGDKLAKQIEPEGTAQRKLKEMSPIVGNVMSKFGLAPKAPIRNAIKNLDMTVPEDRATFIDEINKHAIKKAKINMDEVEKYLSYFEEKPSGELNRANAGAVEPSLPVPREGSIPAEGATTPISTGVESDIGTAVGPRTGTETLQNVQPNTLNFGSPNPNLPTNFPPRGVQTTPPQATTETPTKTPQATTETPQATPSVGIEPTMEEVIKSNPGANIERLAQMLGPQLYGSMEKITQVSVKEMFQNSYDAIKTMLQNGSITKGRLDIRMDKKTRTISVIDNGSGMTPDVLGNVFLTIAGTKKDTDISSGGFGIAKLLFLYGNKEIEVISMRDGKISKMSTTGEQLRAALNDSSKAPNITVTDATKDKRNAGMFPEGHGTFVSVVVPEKYKDPQTGEEKDIPFDASKYDDGVLEYSPLFANIDVEFNGDTVYNMGSKFDPTEYTTFADAKFNWGTARIILSNEEQDRYGTNFHLLSNGLWQFSEKLKKDPRDPWGSNIPHRFFIDIVPSVKPDQPGYPFALNRQALTAEAKKDLDLIKNYIMLHYKQKEFTETASSFGSVQYLGRRFGKLLKTNKKDLLPDIGKVDTKDTIANGSKVEVINGQLIVNGKKLPVLTPDDLKNASIDVNSLRIPQKDIDAKKVMVHDNLEVANSDDTFTPITELARDKFGERFDEFMFSIGDTLMILRNGVSELMPDPKNGYKLTSYKDLAKQAVGVSFDKEYRGVSITLPFEGLFINPAFPEFVDTPEEAAIGMFGTMIHELAHFKVRSHDASFPAEMQRIIIKLETNPKFGLQKIKNEFVDSVRSNFDIIQFLNKVGQNADNRAIGQRFKDGSNQATNEDVFGNVSEERGEGRGGQGLPSISGPSNQDTGRVQQSTTVPSTGKTANEVSGAFGKWFGDSKAVNPDGSPMVLYHGTTADISQFKLSSSGALGAGIYLTPDSDFASQYAQSQNANILPVYARIENPLVIRTVKGPSGQSDPMVSALVTLGVDRAKAEKIVEKAYEEKGYITKEVMARAQKQGYDGIFQYMNDELAEVVAFSPNQVKSVFNKEPTFRPDILKEEISPSKASTLEGKEILSNLQAAGFAPPKAKTGWFTKEVDDADTALNKSMLDKVKDFVGLGNFWGFDQSYMNVMRSQFFKLGNEGKVVMKDALDALRRVEITQVLYRGQLAAEAINTGKLMYDAVTNRFKVVADPDNMEAVREQLKTLADRVGISADNALAAASKGFEANRIQSVYDKMNRAKAEITRIEKKIQAKVDTEQNKKMLKKLKDDVETYESQTQHMTRQQAMEGMKIYNGVPEVQEIARIWDVMRKRVIEELVRSGVTSEEKAERWLDEMAYVPFFRTIEEQKAAGAFIYKKGLGESMKEYSFEGSMLPVENTIGNMYQWMQWSLSRAISNQHQQVALDQMRAVFPDMVKDGKDPRGNTFSIYRNGIKRDYTVANPLVAQYFMGVGNIVFGNKNIISKWANLFTKGITLVPGFSATQLILKDTYEAMHTSGVKNPYGIITNIFQEMYKTATGTSEARKELVSRGQLSTREHAMAASHDADIATKLEIKEAAIHSKLIGMLGKFSALSDNLLRQAVYQQLRNEKISEDEAASRATEIFNYRRTSGNPAVQFLNNYIPFMNAFTVSTQVAMNTLSGKGITSQTRGQGLSTLAQATALIGIGNLMYMMMVGDDEEYKRMNRYRRDKSYVIPGTGVSIPLREGLFMVDKLAAEYAYNLAMNSDVTDAQMFKEALKRAAYQQVTPPTPGIISAPLGAALNRDIYSGRDIVSVGQSKLLPQYQMNKDTSEFAKYVGKEANLSPLKVDYFFKTMFGGYMSTMTNVSNAYIADKIMGKPLPAKEGSNAALEALGFGPYLSKPGTPNTIPDLYAAAHEVDRALPSVMKLAKSGQQKESRELKEEKRSDIKGGKEAEKYKQIFNEYNKVENAIRNRRADETVQIQGSPFYGKQYTPEVKKAMIDELDKKRIALTPKVMEFRKKVYEK